MLHACVQSVVELLERIVLDGRLQAKVRAAANDAGSRRASAAPMPPAGAAVVEEPPPPPPPTRSVALCVLSDDVTLPVVILLIDCFAVIRRATLLLLVNLAWAPQTVLCHRRYLLWMALSCSLGQSRLRFVHGLQALMNYCSLLAFLYLPDMSSMLMLQKLHGLGPRARLADRLGTIQKMLSGVLGSISSYDLDGMRL